MTTLNRSQLVELYNGAGDANRPPWRRKQRWEGLQTYEVPSDGTDYRGYLDGAASYTVERKQPYWDRLAREADSGTQIQRVRRVTRPVTDYTRYEVEWGYLPNISPTEIGNPRETVLILDEGEVEVPELAPYTDRDWHLLTDWDGHTVAVVMVYDDEFRFDRAVLHDNPLLVSGFQVVYDLLADRAVDVREWWARHPELRRDGGIPLMAA